MGFYTQKLVHKEFHTHTQTLLHGAAFAHRSLFTQVLLQTEAFAPHTLLIILMMLMTLMTLMMMMMMMMMSLMMILMKGHPVHRRAIIPCTHMRRLPGYPVTRLAVGLLLWRTDGGFLCHGATPSYHPSYGL